MSVETATQTLHRLTSYAPGRDWDVAIDDPRIVQDLQANDMARLPWFFKRYAERMPRLPLPRELPATAEPAVAVLAGLAEAKPSPLDLPNLSRLLYLSAGVVRTMDRDYGIHPFRAAGSAGGRFPLELYVMDASRGLSQDLLRTCMTVALRGLGLPHWVVVHDVAGLAPGVYRWPGLAAPVRAGALREELYRVCLDQALGRDAAFVAIAAADVGKLGDPEYRDAHLAAGLAEGRLHLAAYALGASASGMTFLDSEVPALLGEPVDGLLFTCVGVPRYPNAPAGPPGVPSRVRRVTPAP